MNQTGDLGYIYAPVECEGSRFFDLAVRMGVVIALKQIAVPGRHEEGLEELAVSGHILENAHSVPPRRRLTTRNSAMAPKNSSTSSPRRVLDEDEDRAVVRVDMVSDGQRRGRDDLQRGAVHDRQAIPGDEQDARHEGAGRYEQGFAQWQERVDHAEAEPTENERPLEHDVVKRQRTGLHPLRSHLAGGDDEGHGCPNPSGAVDEEYGHCCPTRRPDDQRATASEQANVAAPTTVSKCRRPCRRGKRRAANIPHSAERQEEAIAEGRCVQVVRREEREERPSATPGATNRAVRAAMARRPGVFEK